MGFRRTGIKVLVGFCREQELTYVCGDVLSRCAIGAEGVARSWWLRVLRA